MNICFLQVLYSCFQKGCPTDKYESVCKSAERYNGFSGLYGVLNIQSRSNVMAERLPERPILGFYENVRNVSRANFRHCRVCTLALVNLSWNSFTYNRDYICVRVFGVCSLPGKVFQVALIKIITFIISMETVQSVYFCFGAKPANSTFATKTAKKKVWKLSFFTLKLPAEAKKIEIFPKFQRWIKKMNIF